MTKAISWKAVTGPSAGLVREHFVKRRLSELDRIAPKMEELVRHRIETALAIDPRGDSGEWIKAYNKINATLQASDLTINFDEKSWFKTENTYESYTQMYERSTMVVDPTTGEQKLLLQGNSTNPAAKRAGADDRVTFPGNWDVQGAVQPTRGSVPGLQPGVQSGRRLMNQMAFGTSKPHILPKPGGATGETIKGIISDTPYFNPKTKQLFAGLNYGKRPHGSSTYYGASHLVLIDKFKANALYYLGDTFSVDDKSRNAAAQAAPFAHLAAAFGSDAFKTLDVLDLIKVAYYNKMKGDDMLGESLIEAHLFDPLPFSGSIKEIVLSVGDVTGDIAQNARKFANKHGAKLVFVEPTGKQKMGG